MDDVAANETNKNRQIFRSFSDINDIQLKLIHTKTITFDLEWDEIFFLSFSLLSIIQRKIYGNHKSIDSQQTKHERLHRKTGTLQSIIERLMCETFTQFYVCVSIEREAHKCCHNIFRSCFVVFRSSEVQVENPRHKMIVSQQTNGY